MELMFVRTMQDYSIILQVWERGQMPLNYEPVFGMASIEAFTFESEEEGIVKIRKRLRCSKAYARNILDEVNRKGYIRKEI